MPKKVQPAPGAGTQHYVLEGEGSQPVISGGELYRIPRGVPVILSDSERKHLDKEGIPYTRVQGA